MLVVVEALTVGQENHTDGKLVVQLQNLKLSGPRPEFRPRSLDIL